MPAFQLPSSMEHPPIPLHTSHNSKKRFFAGSSSSGGGSSSSSFADPDVVEIPPPPTWKSKHKSIVTQEVIDVDDYDSDDIMIIDEKVAPKSKGKQPMLNNLGGNTLSANNVLSLPEATGIVKGSPSIFDNGLSELPYFDEECAMLQAYFDSVDLQSGVEATVPWWAGPATTPKQAVSAGSSVFGAIGPSNATVSDSGESWSSPEPSKLKKSASKPIHHGPKPPLPVPQLNPTFQMQTNSMSSMSPMMPPWEWPSAHSSKKQATWNPSHKHPISVPKHLSGLKNSYLGQELLFAPHAIGSAMPSAFGSSWAHVDPAGTRLDDTDSITAGIKPVPSEGLEDTGENSILKKLELFKKFDCVEDHSGHFYASQRQNQPKIHGEWRMLEKDLPDTIYVRVYESRVDLLRAVIVGADGTPYHDGLFFFDVYFPHSYPNTPPLVSYHAHGLRINPNLYNCGKVCLSLLGTWTGSGTEKWQPRVSNMLQVLVSIQALILNAEPYYNEPGFANSKSNTRSDNYSENTFLLSLKTMLYTMKNPPKHFEDLVYGHFHKRAHDILSACRAYLDGVKVGSFVKDKPHNTQVTGKPCSPALKASLPSYIKSLVDAFAKIGVKDTEKYKVPLSTEPKPPTRGRGVDYYGSKY